LKPIMEISCRLKKRNRMEWTIPKVFRPGALDSAAEYQGIRRTGRVELAKKGHRPRRRAVPRGRSRLDPTNPGPA